MAALDHSMKTQVRRQPPLLCPRRRSPWRCRQQAVLPLSRQPNILSGTMAQRLCWRPAVTALQRRQNRHRLSSVQHRRLWVIAPTQQWHLRQNCTASGLLERRSPCIHQSKTAQSPQAVRWRLRRRSHRSQRQRMQLMRKQRVRRLRCRKLTSSLRRCAGRCWRPPSS
jgi:hypothetical protein